MSIEERLIRVGSQRFMEMSGITIPSDIKQIYEDGHQHGYSFVYVAMDEELWGAHQAPRFAPKRKRLSDSYKNAAARQCLRRWLKGIIKSVSMSAIGFL